MTCLVHHPAFYTQDEPCGPVTSELMSSLATSLPRTPASPRAIKQLRLGCITSSDGQGPGNKTTKDTQSHCAFPADEN